MPERLIRKILGITLFALGVNFMVHPVKAKPKAPVVQQQAVVAEKTGNSTER